MIPLYDDNPTRRAPAVTIGLIAACILVYLWQWRLGPQDGQRAVMTFGLIPALLSGEADLPRSIALAQVPAALTVLTSMFMHGGLMHLAGNMLYLWIFGNNIEDNFGHGRFLVFYLLAGIAAALGQALLSPHSTIPMVGASGAISGVLGAYLLLYPRARVMVAVPIFVIVRMFWMPAGWVLGIWFVIQISSSLLSDPDAGGVAWFAHIGGFIAGMVLVPWFRRGGRPARYR
ncbi:MAG: rhomboid family intramembrane serine protease [Gammaproteobacteria bacterium]